MVFTQITEGAYTYLQFKGRTLFSIHLFEGAFFIREEIGIASTILPEGFESEAIPELEAATTYCQSETQKFFSDEHSS